MLKSELIDQLASNLTMLSIMDVANKTTTIINLMCDTVTNNGRIEIRGFGCFTLRHRAARKAHNPKTGKQFIAKDSYRPHFKPGKELRARMNPK